MNPETAAAVKDMRDAAEYRRLKPELERDAKKLANWEALVTGLADIATADDMDIHALQNKAWRLYESVREF